MGRILRKKPAGAKKRKKAEAEGQPSPGAAPATAAGTEERRPVEPRPVKPAPSPRKPPAAASAAVDSERFWHRAIQFLREVKVELKKVTWPTRKQTLGSTLVVIVLVLLISTFLGLVDFALSTIVRAVFH